MSNDSAIVWFRRDLRLTDNPALHAALQRGGPVIPLYIWAPDEEGNWPSGAASRVWLHGSLASLGADLAETGSRLVIRRGPSDLALREVMAETGARAVYWNRRYEPAAIARDTRIREGLQREDFDVHSHNGSLLFEPWEIQTRNGGPYKVFTPYWRACLQQPEPAAPLSAPSRITGPDTWPDGESLGSLALRPSIPWDEGIRKAWTPGEGGAAARLDRFVREAMDDYSERRDFPGEHGTSRLSPHLHFGEISPRQIWRAVCQTLDDGLDAKSSVGAATFLKELAWREFSHHLLYHFPETAERNLQESFDRFPWRRGKKDLEAWRRGRTGYPIVDAGMAELWETGWMHNRVRMIVASFLTKHLRIHWLEGARWFWDTLVDADLANNTQGWQWTAGTGADAAPYFRVFNPILQGKKFDPEGRYIRRWCPALAKVPDGHIHAPWEAGDNVLREAGITLGKNYPAPMVDHREARDAALEAHGAIRR